jgi:hypothetical protein
MGMGIPITDRSTIPATGTVVIMAEGAMLTVVMGIGGNRRRAAPGGVPTKKSILIVYLAGGECIPRSTYKDSIKE